MYERERERERELFNDSRSSIYSHILMVGLGRRSESGVKLKAVKMGLPD